MNNDEYNEADRKTPFYSASKAETIKARFGTSYVPHKRPERIFTPGQLINGIIDELGLSDEHKCAILEDHWEKIFGKLLSKHVKLGPLENDELILYVDHPIYLNELRRFKHSVLIDKINTITHKSMVKNVKLLLQA